MSSYLLLRDNRESGPYSRQQLLDMGLKPYDLLWVEGKSAAWRYASEVDELKEFAAITEEQPFDRFFKKPSEEKKPEETFSRKKPEFQEVETRVSVSKPPGVFVSMPFKKSSPQPEVKTATPLVKSASIPLKDPYPLPVEEKAELQEEYSRPLEEIKKQYSEIYLSRKRKISRNRINGNLLKAAGGAVFVFAVGYAVIQNISPGKETTPLEKASVHVLDQNQPEPATLVTGSETDSDDLPVSNGYDNVQQDHSPSATLKEEKKPVVKISGLPAKTPASEMTVTNVPVDENAEGGKVITDPATGQRKKTTRVDTGESEIPSETNTIVPDIRSLASVKANNYKRRPLGGIFDLELTVTNESAFTLDKVTVELHYLKPSEQPIKTEKINFSTIAPNGSQTIRLPDYLRGIKVSYKIVEVGSSQYEKHLADL